MDTQNETKQQNYNVANPTVNKKNKKWKKKKELMTRDGQSDNSICLTYSQEDLEPLIPQMQ